VTTVYNNTTPEYNRYVTPVYNNITPAYNRYVTHVCNNMCSVVLMTNKILFKKLRDIDQEDTQLVERSSSN